MIEIRSITGEVLLSVPVLKDAVSHEELMTSDYVQLSWDSEKGDVLPMGSYIEYDGERYSLLEPYHPTRQNEVVYKYAPQFQSRIMRWQKIIVPVYTYNEDGVTVKSRELDWTFTGTPADAMYMVKQTLRNELGEEWNVSLGTDLPETITIAAQSYSIWSVLSELAELCETEWWAEKSAQHLHLSKCEYGVHANLEVGKDVKTPTAVRGTEEYFTRFYAFGSTRNITQIDSAVQGSIVNKRLTLDPTRYPEGYKDIKGHFAGGRFVSDLTPEEVLVKSLYFEEVYPSSPLTISATRKRLRYRLDENDNKIRKGGTDDAPIYEQYAIWYFKIDGFEFTEDLIIEGLTLSVAFKSGQLRGREFELAYHSEEKKVADDADVDKDFTVQAGEYEIIFDESDGLILPSVDYLIPAAGDEVVFFNIEMPDEYKEAAYVKLEAELDKEMARLAKDNNAYEFESNPVSFFENETSVHLGQRVNFINADKILTTRVQMIEKHLDYPCEQKVRIGNELVKGQRQQLRDEVRNIGEDVNRLNKKEKYYGTTQRDQSRDLMLTMGRFLAMQDTIDMLQGAVEGYTAGINPVTIETMAMLVGNEALQFKFTASRNNLTPIDCPLVYDATRKQLNASPCALVHLTLGINTITAANVRKATDYKSWSMEEWHSEIFDDTKKRYYVYAKVEKAGTIGTYVYSETPIKMDQYADYYHLLVGTLNSEYAGTRELLPLYGFTQILPGQITTDEIRSADNNTYFDLEKGEIGGRIVFKNNDGEDTDLESFANGLDESISKALEAAEEAEKYANDAKEAASSAKERIDNMMADGVFDQSEKRELQTELERIKAEYNEISANASKYSLTSNAAYTNYVSAYEGYKYGLEVILNDLATKESVKVTGFSGLQSTYYEKLPIILDAIVSKAKEIADNAASKADAAARAAQEAATMANAAEEAAKAATDAANAVVGKIDGDSYLTEIEKQSIRSTIAEITECTKALVKENATIGLTFTNGTWYKVQRNSRAEWTDSLGKTHSVSQYSYEGFYSSNMHAANGTTKAKIAVSSLSKDFNLKVGYVSDAQTIYDYLNISAKGVAVDMSLTTNNLTNENAGGSTYNRQKQYFTKTYSMTETLTESRRYVEVGYKKNASTDVGTDSGYFKIVNDHYVDASGNIHVVELNGSFHRYYLMLMQAGYTTIANQLASKLQSIFSLLNGVDVWEKGTYELPADSTFRADLNTALTDYFVILADCGFNVMESKVNDLAYLTDAMKNGSTIIDGGLVMSSLVAVGDTENVEQTDVDAFMNGSNFCKDTTHGKLIHAMGIPKSVTVSGTEYTDLERRAKAAETRIYEDGTIYTNKVILEDGCKVGNLSIRDGRVGVFDGCSQTTGVTTYGISISQQLIQMASYLNNGSSCLLPTMTDIRHSGISVYRTSDSDVSTPAVDVSVPSADKAFECQSGLFAGLRTNVRIITSVGSTSSRTQLTDLDFSVLVPSTSSTYYIKLPTSPKDGQEYMIESRGATLNITASQSVFSTYSGSTTSAGTAITQTGRSLLRFKYYGSTYGWSVTWVNRNNN